MDFAEFEELKLDAYELLKYDIQDTIECHIIKMVKQGDEKISEKNERYGYFTDRKIEELETDIETLYFTNIYKAQQKRMFEAADEFTGDYDIRIYLSTYELEKKNLELSRENSFFRYKDGLVVQVEAILPIPRMFGSSIVQKVLGTKKKPIEDEVSDLERRTFSFFRK